MENDFFMNNFLPFCIRKFLLIFLLKLDNKIYKLVSLLSIDPQTGLHPKHDIIMYKEWFALHTKSEDIVLDIGSNTGQLGRLLAKNCKYVYCIEINSKLVDIAKSESRRITNITTICADATNFDYSSLIEVSCITLSNVLEHIEDRNYFLHRILENFRGNSNLKILIRVPMIDRDWLSVYKKKMEVEWRLDNTHFVEYTYEEFEHEVSLAGLKVDNYKVQWGEIYAVCSFDD